MKSANPHFKVGGVIMFTRGWDCPRFEIVRINKDGTFVGKILESWPLI